MGKAYFAPKADLPQLLRDNEEDCSKPGVYCLKFIDPYNGAETVYIGEADCLSDRLLQHMRSTAKGHFIEVMFFVSMDDLLTKTQVKYLEHRLVKKSDEVGARIMNANKPTEPRIQESERNVLEEFLELMMLLLPVMGFRFMLKEFVPIVEEFYVPDLEAEEKEKFDEPNIILPKPRTIRRQSTPSTEKSVAEKTSSSGDFVSSTSHQEPEEENQTIESEPIASEPASAYSAEEETESEPKDEQSKVERTVVETVAVPKDVPTVGESTDAEAEAEPKDEEKQISNHPTVRPKPEPKDPQIAPEVGKYRIVDKYVKAVMDVIDGYYVVRKGSQARKDNTQSITHTYVAIRAFLIEEGILKDDGEFYVFTQDHRFPSPSAASNVVLGRQSPGPRMWVDSDNRSLRGIVNDDTSR